MRCQELWRILRCVGPSGERPEHCLGDGWVGVLGREGKPMNCNCECSVGWSLRHAEPLKHRWSHTFCYRHWEFRRQRGNVW